MLFNYHIAEARRPFRPSFGTSTSGVKNLSEDLEKAIDDTKHLNEFDDGIMFPFHII